jgi:hypothetical protein
VKGYAETEVFSRRERQLLVEAKRIVRCLPTYDAAGEWVRCHEVARLVGTMLGLPVVDGSYGMMEHSWLWTHKRESPFDPIPNVLDCYAVGRLPAVQLVHSSANLPFEYRRGDPRKDVRKPVMEQLYQAVRSKL